jgi:thiamine biosynthesis protein ThiS
VEALLLELGIAPERVAVELNRQIVRRPCWGSQLVEAGAEVEVVQFVGGG